jgi:hypothetical protein
MYEQFVIIKNRLLLVALDDNVGCSPLWTGVFVARPKIKKYSFFLKIAH